MGSSSPPALGSRLVELTLIQPKIAGKLNKIPMTELLIDTFFLTEMPLTTKKKKDNYLWGTINPKP